MTQVSQNPMAPLDPECRACADIIDFRRTHPSLALDIREPDKFVITPDSHKRHPHIKRPRRVDQTGRVCVCGYTFTTPDGSEHLAEDHDDRTRENELRAAGHYMEAHQ